MTCSVSGNRNNVNLRGADSNFNFVFGVTVDSRSGNINLGHRVEGYMAFAGAKDMIDAFRGIEGSGRDTVKISTGLPTSQNFPNISNVLDQAESSFFDQLDLPTGSRQLIDSNMPDVGEITNSLPLESRLTLPFISDITRGEDPVTWDEDIPFQPIPVPDTEDVRSAVDNLGTVTFSSTMEPTDYLRNVISGLTGDTVTISHEIDASCFFTFTDAPERPELDTGTPLDCINEYPTLNERIERVESRIDEARNIDPGEIRGIISDLDNIESSVRSIVDEDPCVSELRSMIERLKGRARRQVGSLDCSDISNSIKANVEDVTSEVRRFGNISPIDRDTSKRDRLFNEIDDVMDEVTSRVDGQNPCKSELVADLESAESRLERLRIFDEEDFECGSRFPDADSLVTEFEERARDLTSDVSEQEFESLIDFEESVGNAIEQVDDGTCRREFLRRFDNADRIISRTVQPIRIGEETLSRAEERRQQLIDRVSTSIETVDRFAERADGADFFERESPLDEILEERDNRPDQVIRERAQTEDGSTVTIEIPIGDIEEKLPEPENITDRDLDEYADIGDIEDSELEQLVNRVRDEVSAVRDRF